MNQFLFYFSFFILASTYGQQTNFVDFKTAKAMIHFGDLKTNEIYGTVTYEFEILKDIDSVFIDAKDFENIKYVLNGIKSDSLYNGNQLIVKHNFKKKSFHKLHIQFKTKPKKAMYFIDWNFKDGKKQIWTQGQGKYTSNWLPSIDDMNDKIQFDLSIEFDKNYQVIANGKLKNKESSATKCTWHYEMQKPMSSYLVALAIGKYDKKTVYSKSGIPLEMYVYPEDSLKFEPTYRYTKKMFDYFEEEIGIPYTWQNYKQVPVKDFLYAGMENTTTTIFSESFVIDSIAFVDKNYVNINAHELAHQWFGNLVTETSGIHHWLQEGFATYYALRAEKDVFGSDYYYWRLYEYAQELQMQEETGESTSLLNPKSSSTTFYKKGAWVLHVLREKVGDKAFKIAIKNYLLKYQFKNVETTDFISEIEKASGHDLNEFVNVWLHNESFQYDKALESLKKSEFMVNYFNVNCETELVKCKSYLSSKISDEAKIKIITQNQKLIGPEDFNNSLKVRQAIAVNLTEIPSEIKFNYETLLDDASYITIEKALFNLWMNFPPQRSQYLNKTKGINGFNDKNIRILWLALALITEDFETENKQIYFEELTKYTNPVYSLEIRQNAFLYLQQINGCFKTCLDHLNEATQHHSWQFSKFAKNMLEQINTIKK